MGRNERWSWFWLVHYLWRAYPFKKDAEILTGTTRYFKQSWKEFYRQYEL
ncbi:Hypothetical protein FKW44_004769 [Caligus rogercresseyi]|uniref:Uncharacterized protein n=1 Tax=Caligus rogercresseyi TaxID=217165 RepID=A0A7T8HME9_CALRO|nr:Hypothetical protein FKW44_004769 [Caligus rogercresseyi]